MNNRKNITGRDDYVIMQGLLYGIAAIQALPERERPFSNMCDMCEVALALGAANWAILAWEIEQKLGFELELWPNHEAMEKVDTARRAAFRAELDHIRATLGRKAA